MNNLQTAIIYVSMVDSLIKEFAPQESNNAINDIKRVTTKFLKQRQRTNAKMFIEAILTANTAWTNSIKYFAEKNYKIDVYSLINGLWVDQEEIILKYTNLTEKRVAKFLLSSDDLHTYESEKQAYEVSSYLTDQLKQLIREKK